MPRKYVACRFRPTDAKTFTYHYDGDEPLKVGDIVRVTDRSGHGWNKVEVVLISEDGEPSYPTKPILGLYNPDVEPNPVPEPVPVIAKDFLDLVDTNPFASPENQA